MLPVKPKIFAIWLLNRKIFLTLSEPEDMLSSLSFLPSP